MSDNTVTATQSAETIYSSLSATPPIDWSPQHEKILIDWADKATCYKWLHDKTTREFARKNRWFTIPVIIMSTVTGTANFAQDKIPSSYISAYTMAIGTISLVAGIMTTIQQFLKISELNESHRVSSISWGKFHRNIKVELAKSPIERTPVTQLIKACKEEYDRLIETSQSIPNHVVKLFKETFSGGTIKYDEDGNKMPLTDKQILFNELTKPEICDSLESVVKMVYKAPIPDPVVIENKKIEINTTDIQLQQMRKQKREMLDSFIVSFEQEKKRLPTLEEIQDNIEETISADLMQSVLSDIDVKQTQSDMYTSAV
jgi:hypothetical protein